MATAAGPPWNTWVACPNLISTASSERASAIRPPTPGTSTKKSTQTSRPSAVRAIMNPPPAGEVRHGSATVAANAAATTASKAFPPARSSSPAASAVTTCPAATSPRVTASSIDTEVCIDTATLQHGRARRPVIRRAVASSGCTSSWAPTTGSTSPTGRSSWASSTGRPTRSTTRAATSTSTDSSSAPSGSWPRAPTSSTWVG